MFLCRDFSLISGKTKVRSKNAMVLPFGTRRNGLEPRLLLSKFGESRWIKVLVRHAGC